MKFIVEFISQRLGHPELVEFGAVPVSANEHPLLVADITCLTQEVGWRPKYTLEDGLLATIDWWRKHLEMER